MCIPSKIPRGGGRGVQEGLGMDKGMGFFISHNLMFSITFFSVMHFHNHLCISISPEILKEFFARIHLNPLFATLDILLAIFDIFGFV